MAINFNRVKVVSDYQSNYPGAVADGCPTYIASYAAQLTASQDLRAGQPLLYGTDPSTQVRPTVIGDSTAAIYQTFAGFTVLNPTKERPSGSLQYTSGDQVGVMKMGVITLSASNTVTAGQGIVGQVNGGTYRTAHATGSLATGEFFVPLARAQTSAVVGGLFKAEIGFSLAHREVSGSTGLL